LGLLLTVELTVLPAGSLLLVQSGVQPLGDKLLTHTGDGHTTDAQGLGNTLVRPGIGSAGIGSEQDVSAGAGMGGVGSGANQGLQSLPLFIGQSNHYFVRWGHRASS
jgi:hypothetical protein